jgi:Right handed beta helix region
MKQIQKHSFINLSIITAAFLAIPFSHVDAATTVTADITRNTTWNVNGSPYIISNSIQVAQNAKLTINPGVVVKFDYGTEIDVYGSVNATGNGFGGKTYFTSLYDTTLGNSTSTSSTPNVGDYNGFSFFDNSKGTFNNVEMRYANNAVLSTNAKVSITSSNFPKDYTALNATGGTATLNGNTFTNNVQPVSVDFSTSFSHSSNTFTNNTNNGITIVGDMSGSNYTFTSGDAPYILTSDINVTAGKQLTLNPGVVLQSATGSNTIIVNGGTLSTGNSGSGDDDNSGNCNGNNNSSSNSTVSFTGISIQAFNNATVNLQSALISNVAGTAIQVWSGSKLNANTLSITSVTGDGIDAFTNSTVNLSNSTITNFGTSSGGLAIFNDSTAVIQKSTIDTGGDGIVAFNHASIDANGLTIKNATDGGIMSFGSNSYASSSIKLRSSELTGNGFGIYPVSNTVLDVSNNSIHDNTIGAVADSGSYNLTNNWWGDASGPYNATTNASGTANEVTDNIVFKPWLTRNPLLGFCTYNCGPSGHGIGNGHHDSDTDRVIINRAHDRVQNIWKGRDSGRSSR